MTYIAIGFLVYGLISVAVLIRNANEDAKNAKAFDDYQRYGVRSDRYIELSREDK